MQPHEWVSKTSCVGKEAILKRLQTGWFHLLDKQDLWRTAQRLPGAPGQRDGGDSKRWMLTCRTGPKATRTKVSFTTCSFKIRAKKGHTSAGALNPFEK
jgi:hypothetical protein